MSLHIIVYKIKVEVDLSDKIKLISYFNNKKDTDILLSSNFIMSDVSVYGYLLIIDNATIWWYS